jgi:hypothetical protein
MLNKHGFKPENLKGEIIKKTKASLHYKKYRENLKKNKESLEIESILDDAVERSLFVTKLTKDFETFLNKFQIILKNIMDNV